MSTPNAVRFRTPRLALATLAVALALSACGNKGPLVLPDKTPAGDTMPAAPAAAPAPATTPAIDETASPLPPSSPPPAADPLINKAGDDGNGR